MLRLLAACVLAACAAPMPADTPSGDDPDAGDFDTDGAALPPAAARHEFGTSAQGQPLIYYKVTPAMPNGKSAFLTFALHGFEDAWEQDGRVLYAIAHAAVARYGDDPLLLAGWTLYIVPTANPDGMRNGVNNWRESDGAFGRCTSHGRDINRNVGSGTSIEQRALIDLFDSVSPTIAIDFHGWYNTYYGNSQIGGFFQRAFNAPYPGKPARYCFVDASGVMDCGSTRGGIFHASSSIGSGLFAQWAAAERGVPSALVEYPGPDFDLDGEFDATWDESLGYRRIDDATLAPLVDRTHAALDALFVGY